MPSKTIDLTTRQRANLATRARQARQYVGTDTPVVVDYFKRGDDAELHSLTGTVAEVRTNRDHGVVVMVTDKGYRSANLFNVVGIRKA